MLLSARRNPSYSSHIYRTNRSRPVVHAAANTTTRITYGGRCSRCGGYHDLPASDAAVAAAQSLVLDLEKAERLDLWEPGAHPEKRSYSTRPYLSRAEGGNGGPGRMLGVLMCESDDAGNSNNGLVLLRAFSGQLAASDDSDGAGGGGWRCPGWAGPVAGLTSDEGDEYGRYRRLTDALTRRLSFESNDDASSRLRARRRRLSHALIARVQDSYATRDALGRPVLLREAYLALAAKQQQEEGEDAAVPLPLPVTRLQPCGRGNEENEEWLGFPTGTGDCCAPKLLHEAARRGLRPVALAEVWFGADGGGSSGTEDGEQEEDENDGEELEAQEEQASSSTPESKEVAWRRRQRRRVQKQRSRAAAAAGGGGGAAAAVRQHGQIYGPCAKCSGILGTMLCTAG